MSTIGDIPNVKMFREMQEQSRLLEQLQIVFVVGPPKCGTTWVQTTLNAHPHAVAMGEGHLGTRLLAQMRTAVGGYNEAMRAHSAEGGDTVPAALQLEESDLFMLTRAAIDRILIHYMQSAAKAGKRLLRAVIDKTPDHARHIPALAAMYPWARFICVTRDVRDAAVSAWHHRVLLGTNTHKTIDELAPAFAHDVWGPMMLLARRSAAALSPRQYTELTYEDYKADPAREVTRLLTFIGLDASEAQVRACVHAGDFKTQTRGRDAGIEAKSFHRKGVVGDWASQLSAEVADRTLRIAQQIVAMAPAPSSIDAKPMPRTSPAA